MSEVFFTSNDDENISIRAFLEIDQIVIKAKDFNCEHFSVCLSKEEALRFAEHIQNEVAKTIEVIVEPEESTELFPFQIIPSKPKAKSIDFEEIKRIFNSVCVGLPSVRIITDARKKSVSAIAKEYGLEAIGEVFTNASKSDFMNGENKTNWVATFDWIFNKNNFIKVLEGNYENKTITSKDETVIGRQTKETFVNNASGWEI